MIFRAELSFVSCSQHHEKPGITVFTRILCRYAHLPLRVGKAFVYRCNYKYLQSSLAPSQFRLVVSLPQETNMSSGIDFFHSVSITKHKLCLIEEASNQIILVSYPITFMALLCQWVFPALQVTIVVSMDGSWLSYWCLFCPSSIYSTLCHCET